ncbi:MAG TPA: hypothetical protein VFY93_08190 [Planctomycetota bacterium]|nr:hypothetical protein [Planctomycetota bacterium]
MTTRVALVLAVTLAVTLAAACSGGGRGAVPGSVERILLTAGLVPLDPLPVDSVSPAVDLGRLGIDHVDRAFDVSTPAGEPFSINVLTRAPGGTGPVRLCVAHCSDGGTTPPGGPESLGGAGIAATGHVPEVAGPWLEMDGQGYVRLGLAGAVAADQVLALCAESDEGRSVVLLRIEIGQESIINRNGPDAPVEDGDPAVIQTATLYTSDLEFLAAPAVACVGDVTTAITYDGNREDPDDWNTYEIRVRHDRASNAVTDVATRPLGDAEWFGEWRDHEIAARGSVVAIARASGERVTLGLSFDGGATFPQTHALAAGYDDWSFRLAQVALGPSYELALVFWRVNEDYTNDLVLIEGAPSARNARGEPLAFSLGGERVLFHGGEYTAPAFVSEDLDEEFVPLVIGARYSEGGDLVVAYGYNDFLATGDEEIAFLETRCLTRLAGTDAFRDVRVEREDDVVGFDPSVSLLGAGETMTIFVAYEASDGVRLRVSEDGGRTFSEAGVAGGPGAHLPTVLARGEDGGLRVDLLYVTQSDRGNELHVRHWDDFGGAPSRDYRLAAAGSEGEEEQGVPGEPGYLPGTYVERQVAWFGYDAALEGDDVVVVYVEEMIDDYGIHEPAGYLRSLKLIRLD